MKKKLTIIILIIIFVALTAVGCNKNTFTYEEYFKNFTSVDAYTGISTVFKLPENMYFSSYDDESDVYIIYQEFTIKTEGNKDTKIALYGFASSSEILIEPTYLGVSDIVGDYAIVTKYVASGDKKASKIGMVKFRGENIGNEYGFAYCATKGASQYTFLDYKYVAIMGDAKTVIDAATPLFSYATIYDYTSSGGKELLECGTIKNVSNRTNFLLKDGNLVTYAQNVVRYHKFDTIKSDGSFEVLSTYVPYDSGDGFLESNVSCEVYYTGNNWFIVTSIYSSSTKYDGYEMTSYIEDSQTTYYMTVRSQKFNVNLKKGYKVEDRVVLVANQYNDDFMRDVVDTYNTNEDEFADVDGVKGQYFQPVVPISSIVKHGYSLVYYYYYYQLNGEQKWGKTFCIYDSNCERIDLEGLYMPLVFVDGIGLQNADPTFEVPARSIAYSKMDGSEVTLLKMEEKIAYDPVITHNGVILSYQLDLNTFTNMMGAYRVDGTPMLPFKYFELTPYFGNYCTGSQIETVGTDKIRRLFYSIDKNGKETALEDVYLLKNGVYITKKDKKYGLYTNEGKQLIPTACASVAVIENYLIGDKYMTSTVITAENNRGVIYKLS